MPELIKALRGRAEEERRRLAGGTRPARRGPSGVQRAAVRGLAGFFALMLLFTLLSRAAEGAAVPRVQTDTVKTGVLTQRVSLSGALEPQGDLALTLPGGLEVVRIAAQAGQRVAAGDVLLELDPEAVSAALEKLERDKRILTLRLEGARQGNTSGGTSAILGARAALEAAREDYDRLAQARSRAEARVQEDLAAAQAACDKAGSGLEQARAKARQMLIDEAQAQVEAAGEALKGVEESAQAAVEAAQEGLTAARDAQNAYSKGYYEAAETLGKLREQLSAARQALDELTAAGAPEAELQAAREKVDALAAQVESAEWSIPNYNYGSDLAVRRAKDNLTRVSERQNAKIKEAREELAEAEAELKRAKARTDLDGEGPVVSAQSALDAAGQELERAQRAAQDAPVDSESQLLAARRAVESAQRALDDADQAAQEARRTDADSRRQAEIERLGYQSELRALQAQMDALEGIAAAGGKLTAPIPGTVRSLLDQPGKTQEGAQAAVLARDDRGFVFTAQTDEASVEHLAVGDVGRLSFTRDGESREAEATVTGIGAPDAEGKVKVTASLPAGSYPSGASATLEISRKSRQYGTVLPLGAVRSDAGGSYVLSLRERQSVLGTEFVAVRTPVEVLEQDSTLAAVEGGGLTGEVKIVVSATKPVAEGDKVRLEPAPAQ